MEHGDQRIERWTVHPLPAREKDSRQAALDGSRSLDEASSVSRPGSLAKRAGHTTFDMTQKYIRTAEAVGEVIGAVFPRLPLTLLSPLNGLANRPNDPQAVDIIVEAPGIGPDLGQIESTEEHRSGTISADGDPANVSDRASKCALVRGVVTESSEAYELSNVVETALAKALLLAAEGERWDIVARIADELESRRGERLAAQNAVRACGNR